MKTFFPGLLAGALVLATSAPAAGDAIAPPPIAERVARADGVAVGKVVKIEDKTVRASPGFGGREVEYQVAVVKIDEALAGFRGLTHVRVGFLPRPGSKRASNVHLRPGHEACFFLTRHPKASFHIAPMFFDVVAKEGNPRFAAERAQAREAGKLLVDPMKHLEGTDAKARYLTAAMLLVRYRTPSRVPVDRRGEEEVGAKESTLLLKALAEADWKRPDPTLSYQLAPMTLFGRLGVTAADGFTRPKNAREFPEAARKWLTEHAGSYRVKRFVVKK